MSKLRVSDLKKTWIIDIDGIIFRHNEYKTLQNGDLEKPLPGVIEFFESIPGEHYIILATAREKRLKKQTIRALREAGIRFDTIIFGLPNGERILINDTKPDGLKTAYAVNVKRDKGLKGIRLEVSCVK